jgi:hypothetical protein
MEPKRNGRSPQVSDVFRRQADCVERACVRLSAVADGLSADNLMIPARINKMLVYQLFMLRRIVGTPLALLRLQGLIRTTGEMIMKYETLMLHSLFAACFAMCALILGAMLTATPRTVQLASTQTLSSILLTAPTTCALPADGVVCPPVRSNSAGRI